MECLSKYHDTESELCLQAWPGPSANRSPVKGGVNLWSNFFFFLLEIQIRVSWIPPPMMISYSGRSRISQTRLQPTVLAILFRKLHEIYPANALSWTKNMCKQECIPVGCVQPAAVAVSPATHAPLPRTAPTTHMPLRHARPPNRITDTCENITFPQLRWGR